MFSQETVFVNLDLSEEPTTSVYQDAHWDKPGMAPIVSVVMVKLDMELAEIVQLKHSLTLSAQDVSA
jgi:hypothetical protein